MNRIALWFSAVWRTRPRVEAVARQYQQLGAMPELVADIAARGSMFRASPPEDALKLAFEQGRRSLALEIVELAQIDPRRLRAILDAPLPKSTPEDR